jgi:hypothetical protein
VHACTLSVDHDACIINSKLYNLHCAGCAHYLNKEQRSIASPSTVVASANSNKTSAEALTSTSEHYGEQHNARDKLCAAGESRMQLFQAGEDMFTFSSTSALLTSAVCDVVVCLLLSVCEPTITCHCTCTALPPLKTADAHLTQLLLGSSLLTCLSTTALLPAASLYAPAAAVAGVAAVATTAALR